MSPAEYADSQIRLGLRVIERDGVYWARVRPFFYRPLLPFEIPERGLEDKTSLTSLGGQQWVVRSPEAANSTMNFRMFLDAPSYQFSDLRPARRRAVRVAARNYTIKPVDNLAEFKAEGHRVYQSFYGRTSYDYLANRTHKPNFDRWAETIYTTKKVLLLGAYSSKGLGALCVSYWVGQTLLYGTFFGDTESLHKHASDLILHAVREAVAREGRIQQIFAGHYQGGTGVDTFYLMRGCQWVSKPAFYRLPALARFGLKLFLPRQFNKLNGTFPATEMHSRREALL